MHIVQLNTLEEVSADLGQRISFCFAKILNVDQVLQSNVMISLC